jgi:hypothetical protein
VPGKVIARLVDTGQVVKAEQPLVRIDATDYTNAIAVQAGDVAAARPSSDYRSGDELCLAESSQAAPATLRASAGPQITAPTRLPGSGRSLWMTALGATDAFSRRPLSRAYRPFIGPISKGTSGSNLRVRGRQLFAQSSVHRRACEVIIEGCQPASESRSSREVESCSTLENQELHKFVL